MRFKAVMTMICLAFLSMTAAAAAEEKSAFSVTTTGLSLGLDSEGRITDCALGDRRLPVAGGIALEGCATAGAAAAKRLAGGGCEFVRRFENAQRRSAAVTERFIPSADSIRWEMEIVSDGAPWTAPLIFQLQFPATEKTRFWTAWVDGGWPDATTAVAQGKPTPQPPRPTDWRDPLVPMPLVERSWSYGNGEGSICIPIASLLAPETDSGLSLAVSPDQPLLQLELRTTSDGTVTFCHRLLRLGGGRKVRMVAHLAPHQADWRGGLRWMASRYPEYFNPPNARADVMAGAGSYSRRMDSPAGAEAERLKSMAYRLDWDASFNWPYFGMFLPPMPDDAAVWETYGYDLSDHYDPRFSRSISYRQINDKARQRKSAGFFTLAYFNITEFGFDMKDKPSEKSELPDCESWRDANTFLYRKAADGIYRREGGKTIPTWRGAIVMDSGGPNFQKALLDQARQMKFLPDFDGIAIDRMDWLPWVNYAPGADDQVGWYLDGRPGRLLGLSWNDTLAKLGPLIHGMDKVIFVSCCWKGHRLDYMRHVDGFYDEYGDWCGYDLNGSALLALRKPAIMWTHNAASMKPDPDSYFQRHLHMGAYPTAPFPLNDHTVLPDPKTERWYLDYGPLLDAMRGKKWVLEPHCAEVVGGRAKVNLFEVPDGYVAPVTFGGDAMSTVLRVRSVPGLTNARCEALQPGVAKALPLASSLNAGVLELQVPLSRGCAMVRIAAGK